MTLAALSAAQLLAEDNTLLVCKGAEVYLCLGGSSGGSVVLAYNGHVDLGTGIRTALAQIVAEELDVAFGRVTMILGDTARTPDQGATIASDTIQTAAVPLRQAAATARRFLIALAAEQLGVPPDSLTVDDGVISHRQDANLHLSYGELIEGHRHRLEIDAAAPVKPTGDYRVVGVSQARSDIPAKATGGLVFVHDLRLPGMLHGRVIRPPYAGVDHGAFVGTSLIGVDRASIAHIPGVVEVVTVGDFVGVVTEREEQAVAAAAALRVSWQPTPAMTDLDDIGKALRATPSTPRVLFDDGGIDQHVAEAAIPLTRTYSWPYQMHASIGPSCAVADWLGHGIRVWSGTQNPIPLRADLARLVDLPPEAVDLIRMEASGCYGRNCADDVTADAVLLSRAVGRPVRVQLSREQEHLWEPKGAAQVMDVKGGLNEDGGVRVYDFHTCYPSNGAPTLALLLTGKAVPTPDIWQSGDRTAIGPYTFPAMRVTVYDLPPIVRASWLRGVSALPNTFAHESWIDEAAAEAKADPVEYRLRYLQEPRAREVVKATAARAKWTPRTTFGTEGGDGPILRGRGFAYALYVHSKFPGYGAAWAAWVADVEVNRETGEVAVTHVTVGHDAGLMINPDGVRHQIHGNVVQSTGRVLKEEVRFDAGLPVAREWGGYPIITFPEVPKIDVLMIVQPEQPPLGVGESASVPSAAAIANAIYDATGVRFRDVPFTPEKVRAALNPTPLPPPAPPLVKKRSFWASVIGTVTGLAGLAVMASPWRPAIPTIDRPDPSVYAAATIERGRQLAALGDCAVCHTAEHGIPNAGGRRLDTPFGAIYTTNITPDVATGIGGWSYVAFERAMREGIHRDGSHLYPAFPYTHFAKTSDADMQALYAYLMAQAPVSATTPRTTLRFPFNIRPLLAGWNLLFHSPAPHQARADQTAEWNRGAYLVEGLGHCDSCHTPLNAVGAEKTGAARLSGAWVEGWEAPALTAATHAPVPWSQQDFYDYLRTGYSPTHGAAGGPMAPVIDELRHLPDSDIKAMAVYLASFNPDAPTAASTQALAQSLTAQAATALRTGGSPGSRLYQGACAACHDGGPHDEAFGVRPSLALNSAVHSSRPDTLIRAILNGSASPLSASPLSGTNGAMPAFSGSLSDAQIADLVGYIRTTFAPGKPAFEGVAETIRTIRAAGSAAD